MSDRKANITRSTDTAEVRVIFNLDGKGAGTIQTGLPFLDRMLNLFARYGAFDLDVQCRPVPDAACDAAEEVGACVGMAVDQALGNQACIRRLAHSYVPVDDNLARAVVDIAGHARLDLRLSAPVTSSNAADAAAAESFWRAFVGESHLTLHIELLHGSCGLPAFEAVFKAAGRALRDACRQV